MSIPAAYLCFNLENDRKQIFREQIEAKCLEWSIKDNEHDLQDPDRAQCRMIDIFILTSV
jgi:hypothetical protein